MNALNIFALPLILFAPMVQADVLTCNDGAGHQIMVSQADAQHLDGLSCKNGRSFAPNAAAPQHMIKTAMAATPPDMRIAPEIQKTRDDDRRRILQDELLSEQAVLASEIGQRNGAAGGLRENLEQQIHRTEQNIAALNRELARIR